MKFVTILTSLILVLGLAAGASALPVWSTDYIIGVTATADADSTQWQTPAYLTDQSGLYDNDSDGFKETHYGHAEAGGNNSWVSGWYAPNPAGRSKWVSFQMPGDDPLPIEDIYIWNFNQEEGRGMKDISIWYSADATSKDNGTWTKLGVYQIPMSNGGYGGSVTNPLALEVDFTAKWVLFLDDSATAYNNRDTGIGPWDEGRGECGLSEVAFFTPEPATVAILGFGSLVLLRKRR